MPWRESSISSLNILKRSKHHSTASPVHFALISVPCRSPTRHKGCSMQGQFWGSDHIMLALCSVLGLSLSQTCCTLRHVQTSCRNRRELLSDSKLLSNDLLLWHAKQLPM